MTGNYSSAAQLKPCSEHNLPMVELWSWCDAHYD